MKLEIERFKAFNEKIEMDIGDKNLAIYGENGAGKSSLYEALKIIFFKSRIEQSIVNAPTPEG